MKWIRWVVLMAMACLVLVLLPASAEVGAPDSTFSLPASLRVISEGAFEGTAGSTVVLPEGVEAIGDRAFADMPGLRAVYIPPTTLNIGENAFANANALVIHGVFGSPAQDWARAHGYRFMHDDIWAQVGPAFALARRLARRALPFEAAGSPAPNVWRVLWIGLILIIVLPKRKPEMYPLDYDFP